MEELRRAEKLRKLGGGARLIERAEKGERRPTPGIDMERDGAAGHGRRAECRHGIAETKNH